MQQQYALDLIVTPVGLGVICNVAISKDTFVVEYQGEVLLGPDAHERPDKRYQMELKTTASWDGPTEVFIDVARCGNESRFINHSCDPSGGLYELEWMNTSRLGIVAKVEIPALRELTFRYTKSNVAMFTCECGHPNCVSKRT
jgi:histone-lysine N-methyltransferase ASH1L